MKRPFFDFLRKRLLFLFYIFLFFDIVHAQDGHTSTVDSIVVLHHDHVNDINENVSVMVMDVDTIRDDVSSIHDEVKTLTNDVNTYFNDAKRFGARHRDFRTLILELFEPMNSCQLSTR